MRKHPSSATAQQLGSFVLKRRYRIFSTRLIPLADADGIREEDETRTAGPADEEYSLVTHESDMAVYKPRADLVVLGHYQLNDVCEAIVTGASGTDETWFSRSGSPASKTLVLPAAPGSGGTVTVELADLDARENMFGWEQRIFDARRDAAVDADFEPPASAPVSDNLFFNAYRRDFAQGAFPKNQFDTASRVRINRDPLPAGSDSVDFFLGNEIVSAKLYLYHGRGPDKPRYWCCEPINEVRLDTLVITPDEDEAYVLWRGSWAYDLYPPDRYRRLEVTAEEVH